MTKYFALFFVLSLLVLEAREVHSSPFDFPKSERNRNDSKICSRLTYVKWDRIKESQDSTQYFYKQHKIEIKDFLDEAKNESGFILTINEGESEKFRTDSWVRKLYLYSCGNVSVLFVEEFDEGGSWGQIVYLIENNLAHSVGNLDISPYEESILEDKLFTDGFIEIKNDHKYISIKILHDKFYHLIDNYDIKSSSDVKIYIDKNEKKLHTKFLENEK